MKSEIYLTHPADGWETGFPAGNGRQGAVLYGAPGAERILLNEESLWYGGPGKRTAGAGREGLDRVRELLLQGRAEEAQRMCRRIFTGYPKYTNPYHPAAEVCIDFQSGAKAVGEYQRRICLESGTVRTRFLWDGVLHNRELFVSAKYQVGVLLLESGQADLNFEISLNRRPFEERGSVEADAVYLSGRSGQGVSYCIGCMAGETDGAVRTEGGFLLTEGASRAVVFFCVCTDYDGTDAEEMCRERLLAARRAGYETIRRIHEEEFGRLYNNMELTLCGEKECEPLPADELLKRAADPDVRAYLTQVMFAYARYLLISCSYNCLLPANLQGIWNGSFTPPWECGYTLNINLEMNYWMADGAGLGVCVAPLEYLVEKMVENGRRTAEEVYGCGGFVTHHSTNLWGDTDVEGNWGAAFLWPTGGAWLVNELVRHAEYEEDEEEIRRYILPAVEESLRFFYEYLYRHPDGRWLSGPSVSPENTYRLPDGQEASVSMGPSMDHQIIRELAENYLKLSAYRVDKEQAAEILAHVPTVKVGSDGRIMEWQEEYEETEKGHRHISHLYGLYPGRAIREEDQRLWRAAKKTLEYRLQHGGGHTGWSRAWIQCFYARMKEKEALDEQLRLFFENNVAENLWDVHPPFQIDGNFGMAAAVLEALAAREGDTVEILRTIPDGWKSGRVRGQRLPRQLQIDYTWEEGRLEELSIYSGKNQKIIVKYPEEERVLVLQKGCRVCISC